MTVAHRPRPTEEDTPWARCVGPPPVIFASPPRVVEVPKTPVYDAPDTGYNVFVYGGRSYSVHEGAWFLSASHGGPWAKKGRY